MGARSEEIEAVDQEIAQARNNLEKAAPKAQQEGRIEVVYYHLGEFVAAGTPVLSFLPQENIKIRFFIPNTVLEQIKLHQVVKIKLKDRFVEAKVTFISQKAEFTPPVIYSIESREKLVFMVEAYTYAASGLLASRHAGYCRVRHSMTDAINVRNLTKTIGGRCIVDHINIRVEHGRIYGFLGPNGSGKTTTIHMLCGLLPLDEGEGHCLDFDIRRDYEKIRSYVGYMTQKFSFREDLTVKENLTFVARMFCMDDVNERVHQSLESAHLLSRADQLAGTLSGGWKQRLALAACMIHEPQLLLLDEPTAGVDPKARQEFWYDIRGFADKGLTVLVSTHYMDEAERCDRIIFISYGEIMDEGTIQEVKRGFTSLEDSFVHYINQSMKA
jgi:ABC-2 type transport system ATP-binding protein